MPGWEGIRGRRQSLLDELRRQTTPTQSERLTTKRTPVRYVTVDTLYDRKHAG